MEGVQSIISIILSMNSCFSSVYFFWLLYSQLYRYSRPFFSCEFFCVFPDIWDLLKNSFSNCNLILYFIGMAYKVKFFCCSVYVTFSKFARFSFRESKFLCLLFNGIYLRFFDRTRTLLMSVFIVIFWLSPTENFLPLFRERLALACSISFFNLDISLWTVLTFGKGEFKNLFHIG